MAKKTELYDVTIIGGGPAGLFSAFYSGMREMKTKVIEFLPFLGGKIPYFYPEKIIRDVGAIPHISGEKFTEQLIEQAKTFDPTIILEERVAHVAKQEDGTFMLTSDNGTKHHTKTTILATGFGILKSVKLDLPEAIDYEGTSLHYAIGKMEHYRGKHVLISGGGNSAVDWANELKHIADKVSVVYRKPTFPGIESNVTKMLQSSVDIYQPFELTELKGQDGHVTRATIKSVDGPQQKELAIDNLIINHGFHIDLGPIADWGMKMDDGAIQVDRKMATSIPGIFAVGDIASFPDKLPLIAGAFNEGPIAVNNAKLHIAPSKKLDTLFSTNYEPLIEKD